MEAKGGGVHSDCLKATTNYASPQRYKTAKPAGSTPHRPADWLCQARSISGVSAQKHRRPPDVVPQAPLVNPRGRPLPIASMNSRRSTSAACAYARRAADETRRSLEGSLSWPYGLFRKRVPYSNVPLRRNAHFAPLFRSHILALGQMRLLLACYAFRRSIISSMANRPSGARLGAMEWGHPIAGCRSPPTLRNHEDSRTTNCSARGSAHDLVHGVCVFLDAGARSQSANQARPAETLQSTKRTARARGRSVLLLIHVRRGTRARGTPPIFRRY